MTSTPKYPTLTVQGLLTKRGHDLNPKLIDFLNQVIREMPHGAPVNSEIRAKYAADLYKQRAEGMPATRLKTPLQMSEGELREMLYECTQNAPARIITRENPEDPSKPHVYLERYPIAITDELVIYLHHFRMSDEPHIHNHPWRLSLSTILAGSYTEVRPNDLSSMDLQDIPRPRGSFGVLSFDEWHRVKLPQTPTGERSVWTLFMHYRHWEQGWGFIEEEGYQHEVWDDLANGGQGEKKDVKAYAFIPKEVGASPKDWWNLPKGPTKFINKASILRGQFGLSKQSYL